MPVDYSKFDNIEDSDDEQPQTKKAPAKAAPEKPHCANCSRDIPKPLKCGVCKKVSYCSQKCQKEDWQFHKRNCNKPEEPKKKREPSQNKSPEQAASKRAASKGKAEDKVVDNDDDVGTWYRHREWKPSEAKQEFKPTQLTADAAAEAGTTGNRDSVKTAGSAWNKAGTFEDVDVTSKAKDSFKVALSEPVANVDAGGGSICVTDIGDVSGDASKPVIRGTVRHLFDLGFEVKFAFKWMGDGGQKKAEGSLKVSDFTNDTFSEGSGSEPVVQLSFKDSKLLDTARRQAVEDALGHKAWPPTAGTLLARVAERMEAFNNEFVAK